ncbi:MAG: GDSL-type esterase/lipase family protein [Erysipelotrichaceae bacterium]|nr:GDSL-type esterase/lipase family protein [Erysipelotrichaceae bacterium]
MNTILCIGDSITAGWPYGADCAYSGYLKNDHTTVNRGVPGETARRIMLRFERELILSGADIVLIMAGTNDAMSPGSQVQDTLECMKRMIQTARQNHAEPVVLTCLIPDEQAVPEWFDDIEPVRNFLNEYNRRLMEYCGNEHISLICTHTVAPGYIDGVHPDKNGYRTLGEYISREIRNLLSLQQNRTEETQ